MARDTRSRLVVKSVAPDGNCQFSSLAFQLGNTHQNVRAAVVEEVRAHSEDYDGFTDSKNVQSWATQMENNGEFSGCDAYPKRKVHDLRC